MYPQLKHDFGRTCVKLVSDVRERVGVAGITVGYPRGKQQISHLQDRAARAGSAGAACVGLVSTGGDVDGAVAVAAAAALSGGHLLGCAVDSPRRPMLCPFEDAW